MTENLTVTESLAKLRETFARLITETEEFAADLHRESTQLDTETARMLGSGQAGADRDARQAADLRRSLAASFGIFSKAARFSPVALRRVKTTLVGARLNGRRLLRAAKERRALLGSPVDQAAKRGVLPEQRLRRGR